MKTEATCGESGKESKKSAVEKNSSLKSNILNNILKS